VGPASPADITAAAGLAPGECKTLGETLASIPSASRWLQLIKARARDGRTAALAAPGALAGTLPGGTLPGAGACLAE
jgi:hypothetical protein